MTFLVVILSIIALITLILLINVKIRVIYNKDEGFVFTVGALFYRYFVTGGKEKPIRKKDFKIKKFRKTRDKRLKKYYKKLETKKEKARQKELAKKEAKTEEAQKKKKFEPKNIKELISKVNYIVGKFISVFPKKLHITCARLILGVGGKDASDIAITYGVTIQSVQYLISLLQSVTNLNKTKNSEIHVYPDFASGIWYGEVDLQLKIRLCSIISLGFGVLVRFIKTKLMKKTPENNEVKQ